MYNLELLGPIGLLLNLIGGLLIAFSFGKPLSDAYQVDKKGRKRHLAMFHHPRLLKLGISLLILGFFLSLVSNF